MSIIYTNNILPLLFAGCKLDWKNHWMVTATVVAYKQKTDSLYCTVMMHGNSVVHSLLTSAHH